MTKCVEWKKIDKKVLYWAINWRIIMTFDSICGERKKERVGEIIMQIDDKAIIEIELDTYISGLLTKIGCRIRQAGLYYTRDAIKYIFKNGSCYGQLKVMYEFLAEKYGTTSAVIQGGIRRFVDRFCASSNPRIVYEALSLPILYADAGLPTSEFLAIMAEQVKKKFVYYDDVLYRL